MFSFELRNPCNDSGIWESLFIDIVGHNLRSPLTAINIYRPPHDINRNYNHYNDVLMGAVASQITILTIVYSTVDSDVDQRKHQSSASLAFVRGIHRGPLNSPHKWPVTRKMFPFDDVIMTLEMFVRTNNSSWYFAKGKHLSGGGRRLQNKCATD